jgi:hypothetical protein
VSAVATPPRRAEEARPRLTVADRLLAAVPLASIYLWLSIVYCVEAWKRTTPWLFTDELEMTQISRAIASTGHAARRGEPYKFRSLYTYMIAPLWWIDDVANAFSAVKYVDVLVMTSVIFPTYFLARLFMRRGWALFAATGAAAIPSVAYSSWIVEETLAYPFAALCFFLIVKAFVERSRWWVLGATAASLVAPFVRGELIVIPIVLVIGTLFALWSSDSGIARRATWSWDAYLGVILLVFGAIFTISAFASHHSQQWYSVTYYYKHRAIVLGDWAAGALAIGMGVIPFVVGLAGLFAARGEERSREVRMFRAVAAAGIIGFALYTGMKAAYLQSVFATRVEERNLIYIAPLLFIGAALVFERRRVNPVALAVAAAYGFYLIVGTPFQMGVQLYSDSLGFSILQQANRYYEWTPAGAQWLLIGVLVAGVALVVLTLQRRVSAAAATAIAAVLAVGILAWNVTGEISASAGDVSIARGTGAILRHPYTWVDDVAHGKPTLYLGQGVADQRAEWLLEFWNRSIVTVNSLDSTLVGPGPSGTPNIAADGRIYWSLTPDDPGRTYDYAVEDWPCVDLAGTTAATHGYQGPSQTKLKQWRLIQLTKPNRLRAACSGIYADGWTGANDSTFFHFENSKPGWLRIAITRQNWPGSPVHVQFGSIRTSYKEPVVGKIFRQLRFEIHKGQTKVIWLRTPAQRFGARVVVDKKFVPRELDPAGTSDPRLLGAQVDYRFFRKLPPGVKPQSSK